VASLTVTPTLAPIWTWAALEGERGAHGLQDAAGDPDGDLVAGGLLEQDGELVAGGVAQLVVDGLEVVQVDEEQGQWGAGLGAAAQGVADPLAEQGPVGQADEPVVEGLVLQLADHGGQPAVEALVVEHGQELAADDQQDQDHERPVQERTGRLAAELDGDRGGHGQGQGVVGQQDLEPARAIACFRMPPWPARNTGPSTSAQLV
jgi:hypothetical protein